ncbi:MAG: hypothetical protein Q7R31_00700 [Candidatus Levybacteria bacterium]|nr:hypothetical protein [Candidatus Levybacteria bacterium]
MKIKKLLFNRYERGQTLIEVLVALGAAVAVLFGITVAVISSLNNAQFTQNQNLANKYASQGMEIVRQLRDSSSSGLSQYSNTYYCLGQDGELKAKGLGCGQNVGVFVREVNLDQNSSSCGETGVLSTVLVSWSDSACANISNPYCHQVKLISCFSNPATISAP